jgi:predicted RNA-binding protein with PUA-like domain
MKEDGEMAERSYWLFKSEPSAYSFSDLMGEEDRTAEWDGVRNYQARNYLRDEVKEGEGVLIYHSGAKATSVVGTAVVVRGGYPDHTAWDPSSEHPDPKSTPEKPVWYMVDIKGEAELARPVTLAQIKATPALESCSLLTRPRISIHPITQQEWDIITEMGERRE